MTDDHTDGQGRSFVGYRDTLPALASDFPHDKPTRDHVGLVAFRGLHIAGFCWACGRGYYHVNKLDLHHIVGGAGRSDERTNFSMLCGGFTPDACHAKANTDELPMGFILYRKWQLDPDGTDWRRLAILRGSFLPDLILERKAAR